MTGFQSSLVTTNNRFDPFEYVVRERFFPILSAKVILRLASVNVDLLGQFHVVAFHFLPSLELMFSAVLYLDQVH